MALEMTRTALDFDDTPESASAKSASKPEASSGF